ncbi:MAG: hypothetical protein K1000chlam2_01692 [Chlamydiae bacterium]|nr:hypothetical protein [Chlamydiota bacterium]
MTLTLHSTIPITIVAGCIYKPDTKKHEVYDVSIVELPQRNITILIPHQCDNLMYRFLGYISRNDDEPTVTKFGPAKDLFGLKEFCL